MCDDSFLTITYYRGGGITYFRGEGEVIMGLVSKYPLKAFIYIIKLKLAGICAPNLYQYFARMACFSSGFRFSCRKAAKILSGMYISPFFLFIL